MRLIDQVSAVVFFVVFMTAYRMALVFPAAAGVYPLRLLIVGMVLCAGLFLRSFFTTSQKDKMITIAKHDLINLLVSIVLMALYVYAIPVIGYAVSTLTYMTAQMRLLDRKGKIGVIVLTAVSITAVIYVAFGVYLNVVLPRGMFI